MFQRLVEWNRPDWRLCRVLVAMNVHPDDVVVGSSNSSRIVADDDVVYIVVFTNNGSPFVQLRRLTKRWRR